MINIHLHVTDSATLAECLDLLAERGISLAAPATLAAPMNAGTVPTVARGKHPLEAEYNRITGKQFRLGKAHCEAAGYTGERRAMPPQLRLWCIASDLTGLARVNPNLITEAEVARLYEIPLGTYDSAPEEEEESGESGEIPPPPAELPGVGIF